MDLRIARLSIITLLLAGCGGTSDDLAIAPNDPLTVSHTSPRDALRAFYEGIANGDLEKAKSAVLLDDSVLRYLETNIRMFQSIDSWARADSENFGVEGATPVGAAAQKLLENLKEFEPELVDANHATFTTNPKNPMELLKGAGGWKIDFSSPRNQQVLQLSIPVFEKTARMFDEVRQGIEEKTIASREDMRKAMARLKTQYGI